MTNSTGFSSESTTALNFFYLDANSAGDFSGRSWKGITQILSLVLSPSEV
jgi:hypothetical protein